MSICPVDEPHRPDQPADEPPRDALGVRAGRHLRHDDEPEPVVAAPEAAAPTQPTPTQQTDLAPPTDRAPPSAPWRPQPPGVGRPEPPPASAGRPAISIAAPDPAVLMPGALLVGRYRLTSRLSAGTADVWRAEDELLGRPAALKLAVAATQGSAEADRLLAEARALAAVRHPGVVALYDVLSGRWGTALVLELMAGETLAARLGREGAVSAPIAISVGMQLAAALDAVHRAGLVHRDVKPGNLIVRQDGAVRLIDFGIARPAGERHALTADGQVEGTLRSIAPEQLAGGAVTPAADLFGLGTVLFELLEGRAPFDAEDPTRLARMHRLGRPPMILAPQPLSDLLARLLEPNPAARPSSAAAVLEQLRAIAGVLGAGGPARGREAGGRAPTQGRDVPSRGRRFRLRTALLGGGVAIAAALAVFAGLPFPAASGGPSGPGRGADAPDASATPRGSAGLGAGTGVIAGLATGAPAATPRPSLAPTARPTPRATATPRATLPTAFAVHDPADGARTSGRAILVRGQAPPRTTVTRDIPLWFDAQTLVDATGHWSMVVQLSPGENVLTFRLGDDRRTDATIRVTSEPGSGGPVSGG